MAAARAVEQPLDYTIGPNYDLDDGDWVLSAEKADVIDDPPLDVSGEDVTEMGIFVESPDDSSSFDVLVRFLDGAGNIVAEADADVDSDLSSTAPGAKSHFVFVTVAIASRYVDIVVTDTSGGQNRVRGTINFH